MQHTRSEEEKDVHNMDVEEFLQEDGRILGPYKLEFPLGSGGQALVYQATTVEDVKDEEDKLIIRKGNAVALKLYWHTDTKPVEHALDMEECALENLKACPFVVKYYCTTTEKYVHKSGKTSLVAVVAIELCKNGNLAGFLRFEKCHSLELIRMYFYQLIQALKAMHQRNIIHRDIKPGNIFLGSDYFIRLADFGMAFLGDGKSKPKQRCGTHLYCAPEVNRREEYDSKVDIYSAGIVLFEMLYGKHPYSDGKRINDTAKRMLGGDTNVDFWNSHLEDILKPREPQAKPKSEIEVYRYWDMHVQGAHPIVLRKDNGDKSPASMCYSKSDIRNFLRTTRDGKQGRRKCIDLKIFKLEAIYLFDGMLHHEPSKRWSLEKIFEDPFLEKTEKASPVDFKTFVRDVRSRRLESEEVDSSWFATRTRSAEKDFFEARGYEVDHGIEDVMMPENLPSAKKYLKNAVKCYTYFRYDETPVDTLQVLVTALSAIKPITIFKMLRKYRVFVKLQKEGHPTISAMFSIFDDGEGESLIEVRNLNSESVAEFHEFFKAIRNFVLS
mmetsp:Transcript_4781/g.7755  ORF Transcript_4781/g.7755 Transcript_4781/m.7755 type:complete len:554 (+) Transcript_4781:257-1918(+)